MELFYHFPYLAKLNKKNKQNKNISLAKYILVLCEIYLSIKLYFNWIINFRVKDSQRTKQSNRPEFLFCRFGGNSASDLRSMSTRTCYSIVYLEASLPFRIIYYIFPICLDFLVILSIRLISLLFPSFQN